MEDMPAIAQRNCTDNFFIYLADVIGKVVMRDVTGDCAFADRCDECLRACAIWINKKRLALERMISLTSFASDASTGRNSITRFLRLDEAGFIRVATNTACFLIDKLTTDFGQSNFVTTNQSTFDDCDRRTRRYSVSSQRFQSRTPPTTACPILKNTSVLSITPENNRAPRPYADSGTSVPVCTPWSPGTWPVIR